MPMVDKFSAACPVGASVPGIPSSSASVPEDISPGSQIQQAPHNKVTSNTTLKPKINVRKGPPVPLKSSLAPNPMIQLTALASGARIAPPSAAASLFKAAQSKSALHIRPGSGSLIKTSLPGATSLAGSRPNVHYIRPGQALSSALYCSPRPSIQQPGSGQQEHRIPTRPQLVASSGPLSTSSSNCMSQQVMPVSSSSTALSGVDEGKSPNAIVASKEGAKSDVEMKDVGAANVPNEFGPGQTEVSNPEVLTENQTTPVESLNHSQKDIKSQSIPTALSTPKLGSATMQIRKQEIKQQMTLNTQRYICTIGIERSEMLNRVLYRDANGAVKYTGDEPFSEFTETAKRLTILMDSGSDNKGRRLIIGLQTEGSGFNFSFKRGHLSIVA